jgi:diadenosine tetraphosphatase ApaH/serine/threonine PP2A family protein phosphatase
LEPENYSAIRQYIVNVNQNGPVPENVVMRLLMRLMEILNQENNVLLLSSPVYIVGDIHGQLDDLLGLFNVATSLDSNNAEFKVPEFSYLFLGDYVDRGFHGLNTFLYLVTLKIQFPNKVWLLRGNHESRQVSQRYGLLSEIVMNYGHAGLWQMVNDAFDILPVAALVDQDVFCVHGGLSPGIPMLEKLSLLDRQAELPPEGPLADICWSDPENVTDWHVNPRGAGWLFGKEHATKFTRINRLQFVARSHQLCQEGHAEYFGDGKPKGHQYRVMTVWSAPNYTYRSGNKATVMKFRFDGEAKEDALVEVPVNQVRIEPPENERAISGHYFA